MCLLDKIMILRGAKPTIQSLGVGYAITPKNGGMWHFPIFLGPRGFDLTTLLRWFWGFHGAHGPGYMGPPTTTWVPMGARVPGNRRASEKVEFSEKISADAWQRGNLNSQGPVGVGWGGVGGTRSSDPRPLPFFGGSMHKKKFVQDLVPNRRTAAAIHKKK